jgi:nicotinamidase-related amidase
MANSIPALIIIDMQKGMSRAAAGPRNNPEAESNIAQLLSAWRDANATVVHVRHISRTIDSPFWPGQVGAEFQDSLKPLDTEHVVEKNIPDAFAQSGLERWLRMRGIESLLIVGVSTNNSVEATARAAVHAMSLANLQDEYATIVSTKQALSLPRLRQSQEFPGP